MSGTDRASVVGRPVWVGEEDAPDYNRTIFAYLGETDGTHYYSVNTDAGPKIYPASDLYLMTAGGLVPLLDETEAPSVSVATDAGGTPVHPFEQVGKAGDAPVPAADTPGEPLAAPAFSGVAAGETAADAADRTQAATGPDREAKEAAALGTLNDPAVNESGEFPPPASPGLDTISHEIAGGADEEAPAPDAPDTGKSDEVAPA